MDFFLILILIFTALVLLVCINCSNPIYSVIFLMIAFINLFLLLVYLGLNFIPLLILFIYVGAISILLIFVLMILDIKVLLFYKNVEFLSYYFFLYSIFFFVFLLTLFKDWDFFSLIYNYSSWRIVDFINILYMNDEIKAIGVVTFYFYFYHFVIISLILLVSLIGSIFIVIKKK